MGFAVFACLCSLVAFSGWVFGSPSLRSFGVEGLPLLPLSAIGYFALSLGFVFAIRDENTPARVLWALPLGIAALSLFQNISGVDLGTDRLLFPDSIQGYGLAHPGRPGATPTTIFLLLTGAAYFSRVRRWRHNQVASLIASAVLCTASATAVLILFSTPEDPISDLYRFSVPAATIALSLLIAFVLWQSSFGWVRLLGSRRTELPLLQILLPAALVLPLVPSLLGLGIEASGLISPLGSVPAFGQAADGRRIPIEIRLGIARFDGSVLFTMFARDQTERLAAEKRLSELSADLAHVTRLSAMSELAADLAHELNQPLTATVNFLTTAQMLVARDQDVERIGELLGLARDQTLRAEEIIRRLRAFMTHGEIEIRLESVEQTVREAVDLVLVGAGQFKIRVEYDFDAEAAWMLADRIQVQQVLVNLLRNSVDALRHSRAFPRQINLSSRKISATMIEIEVCDTGPGIPDSVLNRLFSRFTTTKGKQDGMGVGLSISKRIIEAHGGELKAENRPEGGASFRFTVLAAEQETQA